MLLACWEEDGVELCPVGVGVQLDTTAGSGGMEEEEDVNVDWDGTVTDAVLPPQVMSNTLSEPSSVITSSFITLLGKKARCHVTYSNNTYDNVY